MTVVSFTSVKGAPGVTTLSCLVSAAWPSDRRALLVEGDPSGGDLAARFRLSAKRGWPSYAAVSRRLEGLEPISAHVQQLPGGLDVMVRGSSDEPTENREVVLSLLASAERDEAGRRDVIADIGRLLPGQRGAEPWLERSTTVAVVVRRDAASILHLRDRAIVLQSGCRGCVGIVVVGSGPFSARDIEAFTGLPVLGELPDDPKAAEIVGGRAGCGSRLSRSRLVMSAYRLANVLSGEDPLLGQCPEQPGGASRASAPPRTAEGTLSQENPKDRWEPSGSERTKQRKGMSRTIRRSLDRSIAAGRWVHEAGGRALR